MSLSQIAETFGPAALARFAGLVVLFLLLRLVRLPVAGLAWLLTAALAAVDRAVSTRLTAPAPPARPRRRAT